VLPEVRDAIAATNPFEAVPASRLHRHPTLACFCAAGVAISIVFQMLLLQAAKLPRFLARSCIGFHSACIAISGRMQIHD
jgi:hypothetical protein